MDEVHALLHTDVVDSTSMTADLSEAARNDLWRAHLRGARDLLQRWRGQEVDNSDGLMAVFHLASDAMGFATDYHRLLATGLPRSLSARAGLHVGPLDLRDNTPEDVSLGARAVEVLGQTKVVAARLMAIAMGGQTLVSREARETLVGSSWRVVQHGHWRMKGLEEPIEVFEAGAADAAPFHPPPDGAKGMRVVRVRDRWAPLAEVRHTLPAERDRFVGRGAELQALVQRLRTGARLVTLHGAGGIGKTRLAVRYGWAWLGDHPGGVWFCDLSAATTLDGVLHSVARGLELPLGSEPMAQIERAIAGRGNCLVILDNAEQVIVAVREVVGRWLDAVPLAHIVITSRTLLGLPGELAFALGTMRRQEAAALFSERAAAANLGYDRAGVEGPVVESLVACLDELPLAIELAAARVRTMSPAQILVRLDQRFRLLTSAGGRHARQATLRATLDWSWDLLPALERDVIAQLSIFEGGFTLAAAEGVVEVRAHGADAWAPDAIQSLVDQSLVHALEGDRFTLLRSVQEYARERLDGAAWSALAERHWRHYTGLTAREVVAGRCIDLDNVVAACRRATKAGAGTEALRGLELAWHGIRMTGPLRLADQLAGDLRALPGLEGQAHLVIEWISSSSCFAAGAIIDAALACERGLALLATCDVPARLAVRLQTTAGEVAAAQGRHEDAARCFEAAAAAADDIDAESMCHLLNARGVWCQERGQLAEARQLYGQALAPAEGMGDRHWQGGLLGNLGTVWHEQGRLDEAIACYRQALAVAQGSGDRRWEANIRCNLGMAALASGSKEQAGTELEAALNLALDLGQSSLASIVETNLGVVLLEQHATAATLRFERARGRAFESGDRRTEAQAGAYVALAKARLGDALAAEAALALAGAAITETGDALARGVAMCAQAEAQAARGDREAAMATMAVARQRMVAEHLPEASELDVCWRETARRLQLPLL